MKLCIHTIWIWRKNRILWRRESLNCKVICTALQHLQWCRCNLVLKLIVVSGKLRVFYHTGSIHNNYRLDMGADFVHSSDVYVEYVENLIDSGMYSWRHHLSYHILWYLIKMHTFEIVMMGGRTVVFAYGRRNSLKDLKMRGNLEGGILTRFTRIHMRRRTHSLNHFADFQLLFYSDPWHFF